jgi:hypothetical protein
LEELMGDLVIVAYRPKPGGGQALEALASKHVPLLQTLGLATDRTPIIAVSSEGILVEVFEWVDGGIERAHKMAEVQAMWQKYSEVSDYVPLAELPEAAELFAQFKPI